MQEIQLSLGYLGKRKRIGSGLILIVKIPQDGSVLESRIENAIQVNVFGPIISKIKFCKVLL